MQRWNVHRAPPAGCHSIGVSSSNDQASGLAATVAPRTRGHSAKSPSSATSNSHVASSPGPETEVYARPEASSSASTVADPVSAACSASNPTIPACVLASTAIAT